MTMSPPTARVEVTVFTCSGLGSGVFSGSSVGGRVPATTGGAEFSAGALGFTRDAITMTATTSTMAARTVMRTILNFLFISDLQAPSGAVYN